MVITRKPQAFLDLHELTVLYELLPEAHNAVGFFDFVRVWRKSDVYKLPCGYIRFEPYPGYGAATVHGIFTSNPFYHIQLLKDMLNYYMGQNPWLDRLECILPKEYKGLTKLARKIAHGEQESKHSITFYWR